MELLHEALVPGMPLKLSGTAWSVIDAVTLVALVSPVLYFLVFKRLHRDISEIKLLSKKLTDAVLVGVLLVDKELRVYRWNQWLEHKTGISSQQACGKLLTELFANFHSPRLLSAIEFCIEHKSPQLISQALNHYVLPIPVSFPAYDITMMRQQVSVVPLTNGDGETLAVVSINDVTESVVKSSALAQLAKKMEELGTRDQLTGAYNRHFLWMWLAPELKKCLRHGQSLSCLMLDIDHFKNINDTYGHDVGDMVLCGFSRILGKQLRDSDILVRHGGEEFVIFLIHADAHVALEISSRILNVLRQVAIEPMGIGGVRCSIGASTWTPDAPCSADELMKRADNNLYKAKSGGRDRAVINHIHPVCQ